MTLPRHQPMLMRLVSWNLNGIRAAIRKGLDRYIELIDSDVWMFQEVRALPEQLPRDWQPPQDMEIIWHPAQKKGYSGVSTWSRKEMKEISRGKPSILDPDDSEGRILATEIDGILCINTYLPSGSAKIERQQYKEEWMREWRDWLKEKVELDTPVIVAGDLNIAHTEQDIWNPRGNINTSGFLPQEREWFSALLSDGWRDVFREQLSDVQGPYSWWSNRGQARAKDRGWRIDYFLCNAAAARRVKRVEIMRAGGLEISDHAPLILDL